MSDNFYKTMEAAELFYENTPRNFAAKTLEYDGFTSRLDFKKKQYWTTTRIDRIGEVVIMEISAPITCLPQARGQVAEYISLANERFKTCNLRISINNVIYVHAEQRFQDYALSASTFRLMESMSVRLLDTFFVVLDKLSHCNLITSDEADVDEVISQYDDRIKGLESILSNLTDENKDTDANDEDVDDDEDDDSAEKCGIPNLSRWLIKKTEELAEKEGKSDTSDEDKNDEETAETLVSTAKKSLLDQLLNISEGETSEDIEALLDNIDDDSDESAN